MPGWLTSSRSTPRRRAVSSATTASSMVRWPEASTMSPPAISSNTSSHSERTAPSSTTGTSRNEMPRCALSSGLLLAAM